MNTLGNNLKSARKKKGLTQSEVTKEINLKFNCNINREMLSKWETGFSTPTLYYLSCLSQFYDISSDELLGQVNKKNTTNDKDTSQPQILAADNGSIDNNPVIINGEKRKDSDAFYDNNTKTGNSVSDDTNQDTVEIPILGDVAAGMGCFADNSIIGYETLPQAWINSHHEYILLRVKGDSMFPKFEENDLLLIKAQNSVDSGDYAVALIEDEVGVVKRIFYDRDWIELISANPSYPARRFEGADVQKIRIVGVVEKCIRNVK